MQSSNQPQFSFFILLLTFCLGLLGFSSCDLKDNKDVNLADRFFKIYDFDRFETEIIPIDIKQTVDGGYLILGGRRTDKSDYYKVYLLKADKEGNFVSSDSLAADFINPIGELMQVGTDYYFFCMNINTQARLMRVGGGDTLRAAQVAQLSETLPLAAGLDGSGNSFILLSYNQFQAQTFVSRINSAGVSVSNQGFDIGAGNDRDRVRELIVDHLIRTGKRIPFFCGALPGGLAYANGYYNFTLSLLFVNFSGGGMGGGPAGLLEGFQLDRGLSSLTPITGNNFAASLFAPNQNFLQPRATISTSGVANSDDLPTNSFPELTNNAKILVKRLTVGSKNVIVYAGDTKGQQIVLLFYDESTGALLSRKYLGFQNPYEVAGLTATQDGGMAIAGTTSVAGRFSRICIFKLSADDVKALAKL